MTAPVLKVENLSIRFDGVSVVDDVSFSLSSGETLAIVGESSSGKTVTALALMRLLGGTARAKVEGRAFLLDTHGSPVDLLSLTERDMADLRGRTISMIFQEPMSSLNPVHTVGAQIAETLIRHKWLPRKAAMAETVALLEQVGIPDPARRVSAYPHQLSGGMRQRVMIAIALACRPSVLIADEPTTALDVTVQAEILDLLRRLQSETGMAMIFITHNLGIVAQIADRVMVMYAGEAVEEAPASALLGRQLMPYTMGLMRSLPRLEAALENRRPTAIPGNVPDPRHKPVGCIFHPRCEHATDPCKQHHPALEQVTPVHLIRCCRWREITT